MNKKLLNSIISFILIFSIATFSLIGCSKNENNISSAKSVIEAFEKNIVDSYKAADEVFGFSKFYETLVKGTYTLSINESSLNSSIEVAQKDNKTSKIAINLSGSNLVDIFADNKDLIFASDFFDGKIYGINLEEFFSQLSLNVQDLEKYNEQTYKLYMDFLVNSKNNLYDIFDKIPVESLNHPTKSNVSGVKFNISTKEVFLFVKSIIEEIEKNQYLKEFLAYSIYSETLTSVEDAKEIIANSLSKFEADLANNKATIDEALKEEQLDIFNVEAYINNGYVVQAKFTSADDPKFFFEFESFGGSYPFENAIFTFVDSHSVISVKTTGENTSDKYIFGIELVNDSVNTDIIFSVEYDKNTKDLIFAAKDLTEPKYDFQLPAKLENLNPGKEFLLSIPSIFAEISFKDSADIVKPTGEYTEFLSLTDEELNTISENFMSQLMEKIFELVLGV